MILSVEFSSHLICPLFCLLFFYQHSFFLLNDLIPLLLPDFGCIAIKKHLLFQILHHLLQMPFCDKALDLKMKRKTRLVLIPYKALLQYQNTIYRTESLGLCQTASLQEEILWCIGFFYLKPFHDSSCYQAYPKNMVDL